MDEHISYRAPKASDFALAVADVRKMRVFLPVVVSIAVCALIAPLVVAALCVGVTSYAFALSERLQQKQ